ncbi:FtsK/SpoIIIE domain-containing protein [Bacillus mycoides]|uniref:FtsK/SpoIIIE domain-containing protein n=1 Tax=Bacillus mycoides TaxID=1405 RepID=UPI002E207BD4|nr:FtsK/SpoIIIE domain-containing protein [Bacillus mycoides]MED1287266.1 FtsK/SpoIIIE domain-containing protein [Bacillus mycoides]
MSRNTDWKTVSYPVKKSLLPLFLFILLLIYIFLSLYLIGVISEQIDLVVNLPIIYRSISFNWLKELLLLAIWGYSIFYAIKIYKKIKLSKKSAIANNLRYMIHTLGLYDEEIFEVEKDGKISKEKRIVRVIRIFFKEDNKKVWVRIARDGDRYTQESVKIGGNLESALGLELDTFNVTINYAEYVFLKQRDKRINLASTVSNLNESDEIRISGNISYHLHKTPHSLVVGGTGSGKSFFILGKIVSYLNLTPQADLRIIDPKKADLSLLRFVTGFEGKVASEANQICKMLREVVELMEQRYSNYFNDVSAFGKTYIDFRLPVVIVIFDEFSAFMHSVDKKIAREALDFVFQIVMKGRQSGVMIEILMQRPSADDLPTNIRSQMGFKAGLGAMDSIGYNMIFDTNNVEYKTVTEKGGGYIQIDGVHTAPVYFETPYIDKDFDFIAEIEKLMKNQQIADNSQEQGSECEVTV